MLPGDLDEDGLTDLAVADQQRGEVTLLFAVPGTGLVVPALVDVVTEAGNAADQVVIGDVTGDGHVDLVANSGSGKRLFVTPGQGDGSFGAPVPSTVLPTAGAASTRAVATGDVDGDHVADVALLISAANDRVSLLRGGPALAAGGNITPIDEFPVSDSPSAVLLMDLDLDGVRDLAVVGNPSSGSGWVESGRGLGNGSFVATHQQALADGAEDLAAGDLDGDALLDLVIPQPVQAKLAVAFGTGGCTFGTHVLLGAGNIQPRRVALGDLDHDGHLDLVAVASVSFATNLVVRLGLGNGSFQTASKTTVDDEPRDLAVADLDLDGDADLIVLGERATTVFWSDGTGEPGDGVRHIGPNPGISVAVADVDEDCAPDLFAAAGRDGLLYLSSFEVTWLDLGLGLAGSGREPPLLAIDGPMTAGSTNTLQLTGALPASIAHLVLGLRRADLPFKGGVLVPEPLLFELGLPLDGAGSLAAPFTWSPGLPSGVLIYAQMWVVDGASASNGVLICSP